VIVGSVNASSPDNISFYYHIEESASDKFTINRSTGEISVQESLDRETTPMVLLTVAAVYSNHPGLSSTAMVQIKVIDVNDNDPQFDKEEYMFTTTLEKMVAGVVSASDNDDGNNSIVTFSSLSSSTQLMVRNIGNNTAEIITGEVEVGAIISIPVIATDGGNRTSTARVTVIIKPAPSRSDSTINTPVVVVAVIVCIVFLITTVILLIVTTYYCTGKCKKTHSQFI